MNKIKDLVKKNYKVVIGIVIGITVCIGIGVSAVATKDVVYDNSKSGLTSTNLQGAIDEVYKKTDIRNYDNIVSAYTYNSSTCVTGEESTCVKTTCYRNTTAGSCPSGTIIKYKVNDTDIVTFHVMYDNGTTMTMQSQKNIISRTAWYSESSDSSNGPLTILPALENATVGWTNVNDQSYTMGTTVFKDNAYTGNCSVTDFTCTANTYTLAERTAKARMITVQEAANLGCTGNNESCPNWMYNYLSNSTSYGGTMNGSDFYYWTMSTATYANFPFILTTYGKLDYHCTVTTGSSYPYYIGARAVVVVNK